MILSDEKEMSNTTKLDLMRMNKRSWVKAGRSEAVELVLVPASHTRVSSRRRPKLFKAAG